MSATMSPVLKRNIFLLYSLFQSDPMYCWKCGNYLPADARFCDKCGASQIRPDIPETSSRRERTDIPESGPDTVQMSQKMIKYGITGFFILIIIAAVFYYVSLGAGFFASQQSSRTGTVPAGTMVATTGQATAYKNIEQAASNIQLVGNVYGLASDPAAGIDEIKFFIGLAPGAPAIDLTKMTVVFSTPTTSPVIITHGQAASATVFTAKLNGADVANSLNANDQVEIDFKVIAVPPNSRMTIELRPSVGATLPFSRTAPAMITNTNVLY